MKPALVALLDLSCADSFALRVSRLCLTAFRALSASAPDLLTELERALPPLCDVPARALSARGELLPTRPDDCFSALTVPPLLFALAVVRILDAARFASDFFAADFAGVCFSALIVRPIWARLPALLLLAALTLRPLAVLLLCAVVDGLLVLPIELAIRELF